jgi:hypothetical protein
MQFINHFEYWLLTVLGWGVALFMIWAFVDCVTRKAPAFTAAGKLTKPTWLVLTGLPALIATLFAVTQTGSVLNILIYLGMIAAGVYMADVRPAVREISGPSRW